MLFIRLMVLLTHVWFVVSCIAHFVDDDDARGPEQAAKWFLAYAAVLETKP